MDKITKIKPVKEALTLFTDSDWENSEGLEHLLKEVIFHVLNSGFADQTALKFDDINLEHPVDEQFGDYTTNIAMILAGRLKKNPRELAQKIIALIKADKSFTEKGFIESVELAGPGFINFRLKNSFFITKMLQTVQTGVEITQLKGKKVAVEYTDPNPFKEFHIGHMYSNFIGESIARIFESVGAKVWRGDFYGDVGMHVAKSVWGMIKKIKDQKSNIKDLEKLSINERQKFLGEGYAIGVRKYEEDKVVAEEIKDINYLVYIAAQDLLKKTKGWKPIINYRQYVKFDEKRLKEVAIIYEAGLGWSLEYFESIYKQLGTKFDGYYPESWVGEYGMKLVEKGLQTGVLEKSEGGVIYRGEQDGLHTRVFVNKLGLPTYEAKDLGLAQAKYQDFPYDLSINVFGKEIDEYYKVVRSAMRKIIPDLGKRAHYIAHGMVKLPEGKMSSRTGNVITFAWLITTAVKESLKIMKNADLGSEEKLRVAELVGLGAVRYALLKSSPGNDVVFNFEKSISFEGDSGPYLMYTYARCKSVLRKAKDTSGVAGWSETEAVTPPMVEGSASLNPEELSVLRMLNRFEEVVIEAARTFSPNLICGYLFDLAQKFNLFYNKHSILGTDNSQQKTGNNKQETVKTSPRWPEGSPRMVEESDNNSSVTVFRLALTEAVAIILKQGLNLLGIETVERM